MVEDAVTVAPHAYTVLLENERVRVLESRMKPGEKTEMHSHPAFVAIALKDGKFKFTLPDGQSVDVEMKAGETLYDEASDHTAENVESTEGHTILVELK